ncbi:hypothetical protein [Streptomyces sp. BH055]|uniref:hypothetical protein n=1 Tax=unclassified Streptomyces TaxID=2593676 RepID=UPI003BB48FB9
MRTRTMGAFVTALAAGTALLVPMTQASAGDVHAMRTHGCSSGTACLYPKASWNGDVTSEHYVTYGVHPLDNQYGKHRVFNNQTGGATVQLCKTYSGKRCTGKLHAHRYVDINLTPYNSIRLNKS